MAQYQRELQYDFTEKDVTNYYDDFSKNEAVRKRFKTGVSRTLWFYVYLAGIPGLVFLSINAMTDNGWAALIGMAISAALWQQLFRSFVRYMGIQRLKRYRGLLGEKRVQVSGRGFTVQNQLMEWTLFWPEIDDILVTDHHILVINSKRTGQGAFPIPLRVFQSKEEVKSFLNDVSAFWKGGVLTEGSNTRQEG